MVRLQFVKLTTSYVEEEEAFGEEEASPHLTHRCSRPQIGGETKKIGSRSGDDDVNFIGNQYSISSAFN